MRRGLIKSFDGVKGYGFVIPIDGGADVLLHRSVAEGRPEIASRLRAGVRIMFESETQNGRDRVKSLHLEALFTTIDLPETCSHRYACRCDNTGEVQVFHNKSDLDEWCSTISRRIWGNE